MAVNTSTAANPLITTIVTDTDVDTELETAETSNQLLRVVEIQNPNTADAVYVKVMHLASGGSTATQHNHQFYCPANTTCYYCMPLGLELSNGIRFYASTAPGAGSSNAVDPTKDVTVKFGTTDR